MTHSPRALLMALVFPLTTGCAGSSPTPATSPPPGPPPARLAVEGPSDAEVHVDGTAVARLPLEAPLELEPGRHFVALTMAGRRPRAEMVALRRDETTTLSLELERTEQRVAASVLLGAGSAGLAAGIVLGALSVAESRRASDIADSVEADERLHADDQRAYDEALEARDVYRLASGLSGGLGLAVFLAGGALFVLDEAAPPAPPAQSAPEPAVIDLSLAPLVGPGLAGAAATLRLW